MSSFHCASPRRRKKEKNHFVFLNRVGATCFYNVCICRGRGTSKLGYSAASPRARVERDIGGEEDGAKRSPQKSRGRTQIWRKSDEITPFFTVLTGGLQQYGHGEGGALTHLSMQLHISKYWPVQCASPVVSFSTRPVQPSYAVMNLAHLGLHASSRLGLWSTGSSSSDLLC